MIHRVRVFFALLFVIPVFVLTYVVFVPLGWLIYALGAHRAADDYRFFGIHILVKWIMFSFGGQMHITGLENLPSKEESACFVANHQSILDVVAMYYPWNLRTGFVGKAELRKVPVLRGYFATIHSVYIDRKSPRDSIKAILKASDNLKSGYSMAIFPEGTRAKDGLVHPFKAGSFKMATRVGAPIIPVTIKGTRALWEGSHSFKRLPVYVHFGTPIVTEGMDADALKDVHTVIENEIRATYDVLGK